MAFGGGDHRRKWDKSQYALVAVERAQAEKEDKKQKIVLDERGNPIRRELLKQRDYRVDLEGKLGKSVVITKATPSSQSGGYYCNACDCVVKDSINFLDHINGKKHQRNLGMSMKVERSSLDQVKKRMEQNKKKIDEKRKDYDIETRVKELKEEEDKLKEYRREQRRAKKRGHDEMGTDYDSLADRNSMAAIMGFSGFGSSKK